MSDFLINPFVAPDHFASDDVFTDAMREMIACIDHLLPVLVGGGARVFYDDTIESCKLVDGRLFPSLIGNLADRDTKRKWFLYTRNRALPAIGDICAGRILSDGGAIDGMAHKSVLQVCDALLSFRGKSIMDSDHLTIEFLKISRDFINFASRRNISEYMPRYEASSKHRMEEYTRSGGKIVAPMRLSDSAALEVLLGSEVHGSRRLAVHDTRYYAFVKTHIDRSVYHGYEIDEEEYLRLRIK